MHRSELGRGLHLKHSVRLPSHWVHCSASTDEQAETCYSRALPPDSCHAVLLHGHATGRQDCTHAWPMSNLKHQEEHSVAAYTA